MTSYQACFVLNDRSHRLWIEVITQPSDGEERFDLADGQHVLLPGSDCPTRPTSVHVHYDERGDATILLHCEKHPPVRIEQFSVATISNNDSNKKHQHDQHDDQNRSECILM